MDTQTQPDNPKEQSQTILNQIEAGKPVRQCIDLASEFSNAITLLKEAGQNDKANLLIYDCRVCYLMVRSFILNPPKIGKRIINAFSSPLELSEEEQAYLAQRIEDVDNPVLKARYADVLWEEGDPAKRYPFALKAIDEYLASAKLFAQSDISLNKFRTSDALEQATYLSTRIGKKEKGEVIIQNILQLLKEGEAPDNALEADLPRGRLSFDFASLLLYIRRDKNLGLLVNNAALDYVQQLMSDIALTHRSDALFYFEQWSLNIATEAASLRGDTEALFQLELQYGESLETEGESRKAGPGPGHLTAGSFYENAFSHYQRMRSNEDFTPEQRRQLLKHESTLKLKIRDTYKLGNDEFGLITHHTEISAEEQEQQVAQFLKPDNLRGCLEILACHPSLLPNLEECEQVAKQMPEEPPLFALASQSLISDGMTVQTANSQEEKFNFHVSRNTQFFVDLTSKLILSPVMSRLCSEKGMDATSLMTFFKDWNYIDDDNLAIMSVGVERYFAGDYISAMHILVPQFEDVLRTFFEKCGAPIIKPREKEQGWQFETFGAFLQRNFVVESIPPNATAYIKIVMVEQIGWNLRNRVAHGLIEPDHCTKQILDIVLHLFLVLTCLQASEEESNLTK